MLAKAAKLCYTEVPEGDKKTLFPILIQDLYACAEEEEGIGMYGDEEYIELIYLPIICNITSNIILRF